jgi:hypothetical protein
MPGLPAPEAERALVDRCLRGYPAAREELFSNYHPRLKNALVHHSAPNRQCVQIAEELSMLVFEQLDDAGYIQLKRFGRVPVSHLRFLERLALHERSHEQRSPSARLQSHQVGLQGLDFEDPYSQARLALVIEDFRCALTEKESHLLDKCIEIIDSITPPPDSSKRKALSRLREKWDKFQRGG